MKDALIRKVANQTDDHLTSSEDLTFFDDGSLSDSAFHSGCSNGSVPDPKKSISSDVAVSYERNSLKDSTDKLSYRRTDSRSRSCQLHWSKQQSISYTDRRECNNECCSKDVVTQCRIKRHLSCCNPRDEDAFKQHSNITIYREEQQCDGVIRQQQRERHLHSNFTYESQTPITEWQGLEELECYDSDNGISDVESEEFDAMRSPSPEDVPSVRPDFVPKLDLSWVFEDENRKQKRSRRRVAAQRRTEKDPETKDALSAKLLKTSTSLDTSKVEETSMKGKAESPLSKCFEEVSHSIWQIKDRFQDESTDSAQYRQRNPSVDQELAHKLRPHHRSDNVNQVASACMYGNAQMSFSPEMLDKTVWLQETGKDKEIFQQQSRRCWPPENIKFEPNFDRVMSESRPSYPFQTTHNSKAKSFKCWHPQEGAKNGPINRPRVLQLAKYYVVDERDSQSRDLQQSSLIPQYEQETLPQAIHQHTMLEPNCHAFDTYRLSNEPPNKDPDSISSKKPDSELDVDTNNDLKLDMFIEINAQATDSGRGKKSEEDVEDDDQKEDEEEKEEKDDQNVMTNDPKSDELYDVEAAVLRPRRKQKLSKFVCCFIGCQTFCCRPFYCHWNCDVKCSR